MGRPLGIAASVTMKACCGVLLGSCFVDATPPAPEPERDPCETLVCSEHGYCEAGECRCDPYYVGDPYAIHGCTATGPDAPCQTTCGLNAYCDDGACRCADGFVAACGDANCIADDRLCDGVDDCPAGNDEAVDVCQQVVVAVWSVIDACDDDLDVTWRLWATERPWSWPPPEDTFVTPGLDLVASEPIECFEGEEVCFGAAAGSLQWGVGADGRSTCDNCCFACAPGEVHIGTLTCEG